MFNHGLDSGGQTNNQPERVMKIHVFNQKDSFLDAQL